MIFIQKLAVIFELLIADFIIGYHLKRKNFFVIRLAACLLIIFAIVLLLPLINNAIYDVFRYFLFFILILLGMRFCFDEKFIKLFFVSTVAYTLQHIAYELFDVFVVLTGIYNVHNVIGSGVYDFFLIFTSNGNSFVSGNPFTIIMYIFIYYITYLIGYFLLHSRLEKRIEIGITNTKLLCLSAIILLFDIVISAFIGYYSQTDFNQTYLALLDSFNIFCCILALFLLFLEENRSKIANDLTIVKHLLKEKEVQYSTSKANIDLINQKCHDLKHQFYALKNNQALDEKLTKEIEESIDIYNSKIKTENEVLDIILTDYNLRSINNSIELTCMADGKLLNFMEETDLYSLFGNMLSNAFEYELKVSLDKRFISLTITQKGKYVSIHCENYYDGGELKKNDGKVISSKKILSGMVSV